MSAGGIESSGTASESARPITISFIGSLGDHTHPQDFLDTLASILEARADLRARVRLRFVGRRSESSDWSLENFAYPEILEKIDLVPKSEASRLMSESDVLVLFAQESLKRYIPGKLFDYIGAGRCVLIYGESGEASEIVESVDAGVFVRNGDSGALERFLDNMMTGGNVFRPSTRAKDWIASHTRRELAAQFFSLLAGI